MNLCLPSNELIMIPGTVVPNVVVVTTCMGAGGLYP